MQSAGKIVQTEMKFAGIVGPDGVKTNSENMM